MAKPMSLARQIYRSCKYNPIRVNAHSNYTSIYHCCTQKTASQWFREVLSDAVVFRYSGLRPYAYLDWRKQVIARENYQDIDLLELQKRFYCGSFCCKGIPRNTIGIDFYIGYRTFKAMVKCERHKAFFVLRDPRDIVVSWYFSTKHSHVSSGSILEFRQKLERLSFADGLKYSIDILAGFGLFEGQLSWCIDGARDDSVKVLRYEAFADNNEAFLRELFELLGIDMPENEFLKLLARHSFEKYSKGRAVGVEDKYSHYRKGKPGDWREHFDDSVSGHMDNVTGRLIEVLGYAK